MFLLQILLGWRSQKKYDSYFNKENILSFVLSLFFLGSKRLGAQFFSANRTFRVQILPLFFSFNIGFCLLVMLIDVCLSPNGNFFEDKEMRLLKYKLKYFYFVRWFTSFQLIQAPVSHWDTWLYTCNGNALVPIKFIYKNRLQFADPGINLPNWWVFNYLQASEYFSISHSDNFFS